MSVRSLLLPLGLTVIAFASPLVGGGCVLTNQPTVERHPDGAYKLTCRTTLPQCLEKAEEVCKGNRYVVTRAADHHDYMGGSGVDETQVRTSEALFVCGTRGRSLWGKDADPMALPSGPGAASNAGVAPAPADASGGRSCVPGATQQCTGPAACRGGQACLSDGSGFSSCDCGETRGTTSGPTPPLLPGGTAASPQAGGSPVPAAPGIINPPR